MADTKQAETKDVAPMDVAPKPEETAALILGDIRKSVELIQKTVATKEPRHLARALRSVGVLRRKLTAPILSELVTSLFPDGSAFRTEMLRVIGGGGLIGDLSGDDSTLPEIRAYVHLLVCLFLIDQRRLEEAVQHTTALVDYIAPFNRFTLDPVAAKAYFFYARAYELSGRTAEIRAALLAAYRTACLRKNEVGQVVLINCLLRNYLSDNLIEQADQFAKNTNFPDNAPANQSARYRYYNGRIAAIQLNYSHAHSLLMDALRKAPQSTAIGFRLAVHKLMCIVQLLKGEMPERATFYEAAYKSQLRAYFALTQTVRIGDLNAFKSVMNSNMEQFKRDKTYTLIMRLRHNVIKAGLRKINLSYSRISLVDIAKKLGLEGKEDAESIVAKGIRDGVIEATIDHEGGFVHSRDIADVYSTNEPQEALSTRINFCLNLHTETIKAMRYPPGKRPIIAQEDDSKSKEIAEAIEQSAAGDDDGDFM